MAYIDSPNNVSVWRLPIDVHGDAEPFILSNFSMPALCILRMGLMSCSVATAPAQMKFGSVEAMVVT
ncbi:hypothetical protein HDF15_004691 [Granulicella mallensis]|uniref:Uncharacterized protein n=1 Tax=Granulicella mallensis TaxID=940614 RepID=A0A7W7ZV83_9BACT|nr:hypothetical protein [Granulicella mallensis]